MDWLRGRRACDCILDVICKRGRRSDITNNPAAQAVKLRIEQTGRDCFAARVPEPGYSDI